MRRVICHCQSNFQTFYLVAVVVLFVAQTFLLMVPSCLPTLITQLNYKIHIFTTFSAFLAYYFLPFACHIAKDWSKNNAKILSSAFKLTTITLSLLLNKYQYVCISNLNLSLGGKKFPGKERKSKSSSHKCKSLRQKKATKKRKGRWPSRPL